MACAMSLEQVREKVLAVIQAYVIPPSFRVTDDSVMVQIPISLVRWQANVFDDIVANLDAGCCLRTMRSADLPSKYRLVADLIAAVKADLYDCPGAAPAVKRAGKKKKKAKVAKKSRKARK